MSYDDGWTGWEGQEALQKVKAAEKSHLSLVTRVGELEREMDEILQILAKSGLADSFGIEED
jgi:hypothetical protein